MRLHADHVQLLVIDIQEKLAAAMPAEARERTVRAADNLLFLADALGVPITLTEQYPEGIGPTVSPLRVREPLQKMHFSAMEEADFAHHLHRSTVLLCGMETHICVALTARDLRAQGKDVVVIADGCASRRAEDREAGLAWMRSLGCHVLPSETVLFALLGRAGTPLFKQVSRRIR